MKDLKSHSKRALRKVERTDKAVADKLALDGRTRTAQHTSSFAELGDQPPLRLLCGVTIGFGLLRRDPKLVRSGLRMLAAHGIATGLKGVIKHRIDRTRPGEAMKNGRYRLEPGKSHAKKLSSMPSGHSAGVAAVALAVGREYPSAAPAAGLGATSIIAAQLPSKNHFLSDVIVGAAIGIASEMTVSALMRAARRI